MKPSFFIIFFSIINFDEAKILSRTPELDKNTPKPNYPYYPTTSENVTAFVYNVYKQHSFAICLCATALHNYCNNSYLFLDSF